MTKDEERFADMFYEVTRERKKKFDNDNEKAKMWRLRNGLYIIPGLHRPLLPEEYRRLVAIGVIQEDMWELEDTEYKKGVFKFYFELALSKLRRGEKLED